MKIGPAAAVISNNPAFSKLDILMAVPGMAFSGKTFDQLSIGGSESSAHYMSKALAKRGHRVTVFCGVAERVHCDDVDYLPISMFQQYAALSQHDVCIVQRLPELFPVNCRARFSALWCHDLAMGRASDKVHGTAWNYDTVFVLSEFMRKQYETVYALPPELVTVTRNGVDLECVRKVREGLSETHTRNPLSLVYSARPERGLDVLLSQIFPRILKYEPMAQLFLCTYDNPVPELAEFYAGCDQMAAQFGDRVVKLGSLTKAKLYELYHKSGLYVYPTPAYYAPEFDEISCISFMEAMACGLPVVSSDRGALPETLAPGAGRLITKPVHTDEYYDEFAQEVVTLLRDPAQWRIASALGLKRAAELDWSGVAEQWEALFVERIQAQNSDMATLVNHFWRRSDIYAARECLKLLPDGDAKSAAVKNRIETDWAFLDQPDGFRKQYEDIGSTHDAAVINWAPREPRYEAVKIWLRKRSGEVKSVLDYGCAHGAYATNLLKELPELRITGVDIDQHGIEMAYTFAEQLGVSARWRGVVGGTERLNDPNVPEMCEQYDAVIAQEVIEHVEDPGATLAALEQRVRDNGYVYITVPFGPWEYSDYRRYPFRAHLWEFDLHDLYDLLENTKGKEADVHIYALSYGQSPEGDDPLGWWVIEYRVTPETRGKTGKVHWDRKLSLQRPRQTVSAAIIAGPNSEETLHWCLRSLTHVVDEVVIADCGLSEEALRIIDTYRWGELSTTKMLKGPQYYLLDVKVIPGVDPKVHGFETPRNMALEHCTQDWILWVDTDEKLLQPALLHKYLRPNTYQGYSIKQHHFAVDTHFDPDLPVRLFRNNGKLSWFGCLSGNTLISTAEGDIPIKDLVGTKPWVYCYDNKKKHISLEQADWIGMTRRKQKLLAIELDDGTTIKATPEHPFLLRKWLGVAANGYVRADQLKPGDRLMPFYRAKDGRRKDPRQGWKVCLKGTKMCVDEHRFVCSVVHGKIPKGYHVHHKDHDPYNNSPDNLIALSAAEHISHHHKGKVPSEETCKKISVNHAACDGENNSMWGRKHSEETKNLIGSKSRERGAGYGASEKGWFTAERLREMNAKTWTDPVIRQKRIDGIRKAKAAHANNHKVVAIRFGGVEDVYNIEMPKPNHNFVAGGVVVHNCIHEHPEEALNKGPGRTIVIPDVHIPHVGYLIESGRQARFTRNLPMLEADMKKYPDRQLQKHFIMRDHMLLSTYELQNNGGRITPEIRGRATEVIRLYREHFLGKGFFSNVDPLSYYSQAVTLLGEGFDALIQISADKIDAKPNGALKARFMNMDDYMVEVTRRARASAERFGSRYY